MTDLEMFFAALPQLSDFGVVGMSTIGLLLALRTISRSNERLAQICADRTCENENRVSPTDDTLQSP